MKQRLSEFTIERALPWLYIIFGSLALMASFILTVDKMRVLANPNYTPSCNLNPIISCGSVMKTDQASVFGFANSLMGVAGFAMIVVVGAVLLETKIVSRWFWRAMLTGMSFGLLFVGWLIYQSLYQIHSLCPYCMLVWVSVIVLFMYTLLTALRLDAVRLPDTLKRLFIGFHVDLLFITYTTIAMMILVQFWYYWKTLL